MRRLALALLFVLGLVSPSWAGFTLNTSGATASGGGGTTIDKALTGILADDFVFVVCGNLSSNTMTVSDGTTSFTAATVRSNNTIRFQAFYLLASVATGNVTYTCTFGASSSSRDISVYVFTPTATPSFDQEASTGSATGTSLTSGNVTTTGTDEIVFGAGYNDNTSIYSAQQINSVAADGTTSQPGEVSIWYRVVTATFTGQATATIATSSRWICTVTAFKIAAASASTIRRRIIP